MKIRLKGDTIRYRLTKTEVESLCTKGYVEEITHFGEQVFKYALETGLNRNFQIIKLSDEIKNTERMLGKGIPG